MLYSHCFLISPSILCRRTFTFRELLLMGTTFSRSYLPCVCKGVNFGDSHSDTTVSNWRASEASETLSGLFN